MHDVTTPLHLSIKPGNTAGRVWIDRLTATGVNLAAASLESWAEAPIERFSLRDVSMEFNRLRCGALVCELPPGKP